MTFAMVKGNAATVGDAGVAVCWVKPNACDDAELVSTMLRRLRSEAVSEASPPPLRLHDGRRPHGSMVVMEIACFGEGGRKGRDGGRGRGSGRDDGGGRGRAGRGRGRRRVAGADSRARQRQRVREGWGRRN